MHGRWDIIWILTVIIGSGGAFCFFLVFFFYWDARVSGFCAIIEYEACLVLLLQGVIREYYPRLITGALEVKKQCVYDSDA